MRQLIFFGDDVSETICFHQIVHWSGGGGGLAGEKEKITIPAAGGGALKYKLSSKSSFLLFGP